MTLSMNLYLRLLALQPDPVVVTGVITADLGSSLARVELHSAGVVHARNPLGIEVGKTVFVQADAVIGEAPALPYLRIEI